MQAEQRQSVIFSRSNEKKSSHDFKGEVCEMAVDLPIKSNNGCHLEVHKNVKAVFVHHCYQGWVLSMDDR
ncbi:hypothetical protein T01_6594 [Trichinella spiralis]|uniref:Uncharacterized protein n=1 Tax=Trichinella spiralis TaxID=6334 RepID=A0A0V1B5E4_TRISP|nr:hypothetical protein T01_6594 [Trichinella spiralis]